MEADNHVRLFDVGSVDFNDEEPTLAIPVQVYMLPEADPLVVRRVYVTDNVLCIDVERTE